MTVIEVADLRRTYRTRTSPWKRATREVEAVRGVDFAVERGELFGLLGPNGAGKTTTIKMLITLLLPTAGTARVLGYDVVAEPREVRRRVGYVFGGDRGLYERLSGLDNLRYFAELYGVPPRDQSARIGELLELAGLAGRENERVEGYSRGMRQRLHIARGLLHKPEVLFLDEPSIGIDPVGARELRATVADLRTAGTTVLLTTHYMFEADELCDRIAVIAGGRIVAEGTPTDLKSRVAEGTVVEVEVYGGAESVLAEVHAIDGVRSAGVEEIPPPLPTTTVLRHKTILVITSEYGEISTKVGARPVQLLVTIDRGNGVRSRTGSASIRNQDAAHSVSRQRASQMPRPYGSQREHSQEPKAPRANPSPSLPRSAQEVNRIGTRLARVVLTTVLPSGYEHDTAAPRGAARSIGCPSYREARDCGRPAVALFRLV